MELYDETTQITVCDFAEKAGITKTRAHQLVRARRVETKLVRKLRTETTVRTESVISREDADALIADRKAMLERKAQRQAARGKVQS